MYNQLLLYTGNSRISLPLSQTNDINQLELLQRQCLAERFYGLIGNGVGDCCPIWVRHSSEIIWKTSMGVCLYCSNFILCTFSACVVHIRMWFSLCNNYVSVKFGLCMSWCICLENKKSKKNLTALASMLLSAVPYFPVCSSYRMCYTSSSLV